MNNILHFLVYVIGSTSMILGVLWLLRHLILTRLTASVRHAAMKLSSENSQVKTMFENVFGSLSIESIDANDSLSCRPFMSKASWALFYAYHSILAHGFLKIEMLKNTIECHKDVVDDESIKQVILAVLPQKKDMMASMTPESYSYFIQEIKELLLLELRNMLEGREQDEQILARSTSIIEAAQSLSLKL